ncbi:choice-of-anchor A family protein [Motilimonas cestriensis]|uniref:Choice-of-anchor A family protein n=1 Tax=Motilimonas cestriensis TaxID=2742685 RepID=A0ABS8W7X0_9GAMM|nr:choice-of-anchor A family protein [Motilimonas cestriensis]MCE2593853.1 choice-of-anchor A family protein [Motilimonas cestriensis]
MNFKMKTIIPFALSLPLMVAGVNAEERDVRVSLGEAGQYNAFVFNDFNAPSSKVEGRIAVGGNLNIDGYSVADKLPMSDDGFSVVVGGDATYPTGRVYAGHVLVGGSAQNIGNAVRFGLTQEQVLWDNIDLPFNFDNVRTELLNKSAELSLLANTGTVEIKWGGLYLTGDCQSDLQVFNVNGADILNSHTFDVSCIPDNASVIINISGQAPGFSNVSLSTLTKHRNRVLYNFYEATSLTLRGVYVEGSVLAPYADISNPSGTVNGTLIANSWNGTMSFSLQPFEAYNEGYKQCEGIVLPL